MKINAVTYTVLLKSLDSSEKGTSALEEIWKEMKQKGIKRNNSIYCILITAFAKRNNMTGVSEAIRDMEDSNILPNSFTKRAILFAIIQTADLESAHQYLYKVADTLSDCVLHNTMMMGYVRANKLDKAFQVLNEIKHLPKIQPTIITYTTLIGGLAKENDTERIDKTLNEAKLSGITPSTETYQVLIRNAIEQRNFERARMFLNDMELEEIIPPSSLYLSIVKFALKYQEPGIAKSILSEMSKYHPTSIDISYWKQTCKLLGTDSVDMSLSMIDFIHSMQQYSKDDIISVYKLLIRTMDNVDNIDDLELVRQHFTKYYTPDETVWSQMLWIYSRVGNTELAEKMYKEMISNKIKPNIKSYCAILNAYIKAKDLENAITVENQMKKQGIKPNKYAQTTMLTGILTIKHNSREMFQKFKEYSKLGAIIEDTVVDTMINGFLKKSESNSAVECLEFCTLNNIEVNFSSFMKVFTLLLKKNDVEKALKIISMFPKHYGFCTKIQIEEYSSIYKNSQATITNNFNQIREKINKLNKE